MKIPLKYFKHFNRLCNNFQWTDKQHRVKLEKLQRTVDQGGNGGAESAFVQLCFQLETFSALGTASKRAPPWYSHESLTPPYALHHH